MKYLFSLITIFLTSLSLTAGQRETIWPKGRMPHRQDHQIAAMTDEAGKEGFDADRNRTLALWTGLPLSWVSLRTIPGGWKPVFSLN